jgi:uncharacterized protein (TIGR01777 family)
MKIAIPGGSGQIGTFLARALARSGHEVVVLSRNPAAATDLASAPWRTVHWDGESLGDWTCEIDGADVVVNLAGRSVNCRYGAANRTAIMQSRVKSTRILGEAIARARRPPPTWLQASTATIYAHRYDAANDEATGILGGDEPGVPETWNFSIDVAKSWERVFTEAAVPKTRRVALRAAMAMNPDRGSTFDLLLGLVRRGLGGRAADGRQYMSWIHHEDFVSAILWLIDHTEISGTVNLAAPNPVPNSEFMKTLRDAWGIRIGIPATRWMLELGAWVMRSETELILKSRRVVPARLLQGGFEFKFPTWPEAARDLCAEWRRVRD